MTQTEQDPPAVAATPPPWAGGDIVATVLALLEAAALTTAMRRVASWNPQLHLYVDAARERRPRGLADGSEQAGGRLAPGGAGCRGHDQPSLGRGWIPERPAA